MKTFTDAEIEQAQEHIIKGIREKVGNSVSVWVESGSVMLGFGGFVAEINSDEVEHVAEDLADEA